MYAKTLVFSPEATYWLQLVQIEPLDYMTWSSGAKLGATHPASVEAHAVRECAFSSSGRSLVVAAENGLRQWNVANVKPISRDIEGGLTVCVCSCGAATTPP